MEDYLVAPPQTASLLIPAHPLLGREEAMKLLFDDVMSDISHNRKTSLRISELAQLQQLRHHTNSISIDHFINSRLALFGMTATTENQQTVSPVRTATGDAIVGSEGVVADDAATANAAIAASLGNLASALVPIIIAAGGIVTVQTLAAMLPIVVAATEQGAGTTSTAR